MSKATNLSLGRGGRALDEEFLLFLVLCVFGQLSHNVHAWSVCDAQVVKQRRAVGGRTRKRVLFTGIL